jgi:5'-3' exonuclease
MGVPGFFAWLQKNKKKLGTHNLIHDNINVKIKYLMLDANCLLHPCANNIIKKYKLNNLYIDNTKPIRYQIEDYIWNLIENYIDEMIKKVNPEVIFIAIDGVAPMGKILQQRQRRYRYLFDTKIKLNQIEEIKYNIDSFGINLPEIPITSIELTPGTDWMERIHKCIEQYVKKLDNKGLKYIYSSYHEEGEGEHKILQYIKQNLNKDDSVIIYGLDADLLFLSLSIGVNNDIYIMREKQVFNNKEIDLDEYPEYNYVKIKELHKLITNLNISIPDFIVLCYLIGNDFLPNILTLDVKKGGLDKIFQAFNNVLNKFNIPIYDNFGNITNKLVIESIEYDINHELLIEIFKELLWTEKYIWKNINRDCILNNNNIIYEDKELYLQKKEDEKKNKIIKFVSGLSDTTDCLSKIEFNSKTEFYNYYLGIDCLDIDKIIIIKMVKDYIVGIKWCINYYLCECKDWSWGYNFMITPLISDIIKYYPSKIKYNKNLRNLNPVEQLILAIPPETYKYVIEENIIKLLQDNKKIGYMFPISFDLDINKESKLWKCQVKIPSVEYEEYISEIKKINISNNKNLIYRKITNL